MTQGGGGGTDDGIGNGSGVLLLWIGTVVLLVVPWASPQNHAHWHNISWIPFVSGPIKAMDLVGNTLLYLPFAFYYARGRGRRGLYQAVAFGFLLSLTSEFSQVFSHGRFPSSTDLTCNVLGAWIGAWCARHVTVSEGDRPGHRRAGDPDAYEPGRP